MNIEPKQSRTPAGLILLGQVPRPAGALQTAIGRAQRMQEVVDDPERLSKVLALLPRRARREYTRRIRKGDSKVQALAKAVARSRQ
jgi:hypothetical protein